MASRRLRILLFAAVTSAIGCEAFQRSPESSGSGNMLTAPTTLNREVDDVAGGVTTDIPTIGGCDEPPCIPPPPKPQPVSGQFVVTSADGGAIRSSYQTTTTPSGTPLVGNIIGNSDATSAVGTGRFAGVTAAIFSVEFLGGSTAKISLRWSIAQAGLPDGYRSYGDSATLPYSSQKVSDSSCASGYRFTATLSGQMENIGRFTATLNHCVSPIQ